ncbi:Cytochrome P450 4g15 [Eumeta japonica]|uniref:Cytochrome P450 4g15 n=1 Tax=Eumeta variegata TaxID=151549 RepID=A0A4C1T0K4_EUMVA|nr:Cytochrome P450 4g15 [Eumeta japonica]
MGIDRKIQDKSGFDYAMAVMKMCDIIHQRHYKFWLRLDFMFRFTSVLQTTNQSAEHNSRAYEQGHQKQKEAYLKNSAGITPPTLEELMRTPESSDDVSGAQTLADAVFEGYRDDLDANDENDIGNNIIILRSEKRLAFLDLLVESAETGVNNISDEEIKEEVDTIMFEGHDTTAAGSSFVLCLLGVHQDIQAKVYDELYEIFGDSDRPATFADTLQMKYLERLQTITSCPAGTTIIIPMLAIHRHPEHYKNPNVFDRTTFTGELSGRHYYSFIPFSAGPRSCVGQVRLLKPSKILLSTVLRDYRVVGRAGGAVPAPRRHHPEARRRLQAQIGASGAETIQHGLIF